MESNSAKVFPWICHLSSTALSCCDSDKLRPCKVVTSLMLLTMLTMQVAQKAPPVKTVVNYNNMVIKGDVIWYITSLMSIGSYCCFLSLGRRCCGCVAVVACACEPAKPFNTPLEIAG